MNAANPRGVVGRVRGLVPGAYPENKEFAQFDAGDRGDRLHAWGLPDRAELVRHGDSWQSMSNTYTALTAIPTTVGIYGLWNGEPDNGKSYVIDSVLTNKVLADTTQVDSIGLFATLVRPPVAAITDAGIALVSLSGRPRYDGRARTAMNVTTVAGRWDFLGDSPFNAQALAGTGWQQWEVPLFGKYIVPPGGMFAIHRAEVTATAGKFRVTFRWHEVRLPIV